MMQEVFGSAGISLVARCHKDPVLTHANQQAANASAARIGEALLALLCVSHLASSALASSTRFCTAFMSLASFVYFSFASSYSSFSLAICALAASASPPLPEAAASAFASLAFIASFCSCPCCAFTPLAADPVASSDSPISNPAALASALSFLTSSQSLAYCAFSASIF